MAVVIITMTFYWFGRFRLSSRYTEEQAEQDNGGTTSFNEMDVDGTDDIDRIEDLVSMEDGRDLFGISEPESTLTLETPRQFIERLERAMTRGEASSSSDLGPTSPESMPNYYGCPPYPGVRFIAKFPTKVFIPKNEGRVYHTHRECVHIDKHDQLKRYTHCTVCARSPDKPSAEMLLRATIVGNQGTC